MLGDSACSRSANVEKSAGARKKLHRCVLAGSEPFVFDLRCLDAAVFAFGIGVLLVAIGAAAAVIAVVTALMARGRIQSSSQLRFAPAALAVVPALWFTVTRRCGGDADVLRWLWLWAIAETFFAVAVIAVAIARR